MELKLDFGAGREPRDGFESVDLYVRPEKDRPEPHHQVDLLELPLPWDTSSVDELHCHHFLEFIPERDTSFGLAKSLVEAMPKDLFPRLDLWFAFMDECWRILRPDAVMSVKVANAWCTMAYSDPCMRRRYTAESFAYLQREFREANNARHYCAGDWGVQIAPIVSTDMTTMHDLAKQYCIQHELNQVFAWIVTLVARK